MIICFSFFLFAEIIDVQTNTNKLNLGDIVLLTQARVGVVRYIGHVNGLSQSDADQYIGIEIRITDGVVGDNNGTYNHKTYFKCPTNAGLFIEPTQILQVYSPEDLLEMIINLKDKLLPLMDNTNNNSQKCSNPRLSKNKNGHISRRSNNRSNGWPSQATMQYIKEEEDIQDTIQTRQKLYISRTSPSPSPIATNNITTKQIARSRSNGSSVHFNLDVHNASFSNNQSGQWSISNRGIFCFHL